MKIFFDRIGDEGIARLRDALAKIVAERFGAGTITLRNTATIGYGTV